MASREITDERGKLWHVWDVHPDSLERRIADDPLLRPAIERRRKPQTRVRISSPQMVGGWLAFDGSGERRRVAPVPDHWEEMNDAALLALLASAESIGGPRRLLE
jgi:hypothetical protein